MSTLPSSPSASVRRRNPSLWPLPAHVGRFDGPDHTQIPPKRLRQSSKPLLNKLEGEWLEMLKSTLWDTTVIWSQALRFKLGNGIWYKPDFVTFSTLVNFNVTCWEVKGPKAFRGGFENLKVAASLYPEIRWVLVWKDKHGIWQEQAVLP